jgi:hypothetical protein
VLKIKIESVMKQLEVWFLNHELTLNTTKTRGMSFHSSQCRHPYKPHIPYNDGGGDDDDDISYFIQLPTISALLLYIYSFA